jgi:TRAP-type C4-dicarboxylate transport system permease small subunit
VLDLAARLVIGLAGLALVLLLLITGWMVFGRYVLNDTPTWVEKAALLAILYVALPVAWSPPWEMVAGWNIAHAGHA